MAVFRLKFYKKKFFQQSWIFYLHIKMIRCMGLIFFIYLLVLINLFCMSPIILFICWYWFNFVVWCYFGVFCPSYFTHNLWNMPLFRRFYACLIPWYGLGVLIRMRGGCWRIAFYGIRGFTLLINCKSNFQKKLNYGTLKNRFKSYILVHGKKFKS